MYLLSQLSEFACSANSDSNSGYYGHHMCAQQGADVQTQTQKKQIVIWLAGNEEKQQYNTPAQHVWAFILAWERYISMCMSTSV